MSERDPKPLLDPTISVSLPSTTSGLDTSHGLPAGTGTTPPSIGQYVLLNELGRGGMGIVFRAEDPHLKREVALKVMLPQFAANPQAKARFVREARSQARVEHDHVAAIHQVAEHDGLPYLVMPLLKGMTLQAALQGNPRPPLNEVLRIGREVAEGLAAAHEKGLVHRDIKPANIWLEGKKLRVKVLDFGLARVADNDEHTSMSGPVTHEGAIIGTPAYMSPEQGRGLPVDARTDLWSLGVVLYQMTTGELPFNGPNTIAILSSLGLDTPAAPIEKNPAVPLQLSTLVMGLLSKNPAGRPPTAEAVVEELRQIELGLLNAVRIIPLESAVPAALPIAGADPFSELDGSEANSASIPTAEASKRELTQSPTPRKSSGFPTWMVLGGILLAAGGVGGYVFVQRQSEKDSQTEGAKTINLPPTIPSQKPPGDSPKPTTPRVIPNTPADEQALRGLVQQLSPEFDATVFGATPQVVFPVAMAADLNGDLYVAVDERGQAAGPPGGGRILKCIDANADGKVDDVRIFARVEHPRGVLVRDGVVWVMHSGTLSVYHDDNGDGVSDREEVLVTGLTTDTIKQRADHSANCIRMGIDGWLYLGIGDFGILKATGKDGRTVTLRGGGVVRVRPDGNELELYATGMRNPFDLAIDPFMNIFYRDNSNSGGGWDTRVNQVFQSGEYGYTQLFTNFTDETLPTMGTFGSGGGTGAVFIHDARWPSNYNHRLLTASHGRQEVYHHALKGHDPTFDLRQDLFVKVPRVTGMELDSSGRLYIASWRDGPNNTGVIARITPKGWTPSAVPNLRDYTTAQLTKYLQTSEAVRSHVQWEILRRGQNPEMSEALATLALNGSGSGSLARRVAAIFTLKQLAGKDSHPTLLKLAADPDVRQFALRALTDRQGELAAVDPEVFINSLGDPSARVRAQAIISLGRINNAALAKHLLPLTERPKGSAIPTQKPVQSQPDPDRIVPHLAIRALVSMNAIDTCLEALDGPYSQGALWAMRYMHDSKLVEGLIKKLGSATNPELRRGILSTLIRLCQREAEFKGTWWNTRPNADGPYFDPVDWEKSDRIRSVISTAFADGNAEQAAFLKTELARHRVTIKGLTGAETVTTDKQKPIVVTKVDPKDPDQIGNLTYEKTVERVLAEYDIAKADPKKGEVIFQRLSCSACHTTADGQTPKGPHLVDIGKKYKPEEMLEAILKPSAKIAQGFETYRFVMANEQVFTGFVVTEGARVVLIREVNGVQRELKKSDIAMREQQKQSTMPDGLVDSLKPSDLAALMGYLSSLK